MHRRVGCARRQPVFPHVRPEIEQDHAVPLPGAIACGEARGDVIVSIDSDLLWTAGSLRPCHSP